MFGLLPLGCKSCSLTIRRVESALLAESWRSFVSARHRAANDMMIASPNFNLRLKNNGKTRETEEIQYSKKLSLAWRLCMKNACKASKL
jgi:hypothetical protein